MGRKVLYWKLVLTAVFWGGTFVAGRVIARELPPFSAAFLRFVVASAVLAVFLKRDRGRIPILRSHQVLPAVLLGLTGVFAYNAFFFTGLQTVTASRASLIIASNPVFIALCSSLFFRERLGLVGAVGVAISVCGAATIITHGHPLAIAGGGLDRGELLIFGCVASWVAYSLIGKLAMRDMAPLVAVAYACAIGAAFLSVPAFFEGVGRRVMACSPAVWLGIAYLGYCGSALGFIWYYEGIREIGPARAGVFINLVPVSAVLLAFLLLHESLDRSLLIGAALVGLGVYLTNRRPRLARTPNLVG